MKSMQRQHKVKELINQFPFLTDNTNQLVTYYWSYIEGAASFNDVSNCSSAESITRAFRRLVKSGEVTVSEETKQKRQQYQQEFREEYKAV
ncbi:hypothetical protein EVU96_08680 [Bacillus infantis]|uniref:hypothetical protein n=1 Tax=Bacillus infantis TaxID=324767 RepID=UPI00101E1228|nr:hypothetical protein [Bacillus infantis]RYI30478.1 hypothetical protein EVU96_08680 [Bacillus infantis]